MTYDQAIAVVKCAMKAGQTIGVSWDELEETFTVGFEVSGAPAIFESYERAVMLLPHRGEVVR